MGQGRGFLFWPASHQCPVAHRVVHQKSRQRNRRDRSIDSRRLEASGERQLPVQKQQANSREYHRHARELRRRGQGTERGRGHERRPSGSLAQEGLEQDQGEEREQDEGGLGQDAGSEMVEVKGGREDQRGAGRKEGQGKSSAQVEARQQDDQAKGNGVDQPTGIGRPDSGQPQGGQEDGKERGVIQGI